MFLELMCVLVCVCVFVVCVFVCVCVCVCVCACACEVKDRVSMARKIHFTMCNIACSPPSLQQWAYASTIILYVFSLTSASIFQKLAMVGSPGGGKIPWCQQNICHVLSAAFV